MADATSVPFAMPAIDEFRQEARRNTRARFEQWAKNPTCEANTLSAVHNVRLDKAAEAVGSTRASASRHSPSPAATGSRPGCSTTKPEGSAPRSSEELSARRLRRVPRPTAEDERRHADRHPSIRRSPKRTGGSPTRGRPGRESIVAGPMIKIPKRRDPARGAADHRRRRRHGHGRRPASSPSARSRSSPTAVATPIHSSSPARARPASIATPSALRRRARLADDLDIAPDGFLVFTWPGSNSPSVRAGEDLTYQAIRAERGFDRLEEVAQSIVRDDDFAADNPTLISGSRCADRLLGGLPVILRPRAALPPRAEATTPSSSVVRSSGCWVTPRSRERSSCSTAPIRQTTAKPTCSGKWPAMSRPRGRPKLRAWEAGAPSALRDDPPRGHAAGPGAGRRVRPDGRRVAAVGDRLGDRRRRADDPSRSRRPRPRRRGRAARRLRRGPARHCGSTTGRTTRLPRSRSPDELRQVWLPNGQHVAMLHQLSYTYSQTKFGGENQDILRALGPRRRLDVP